MNAPASLIDDLLAIKQWSQRPAGQDTAEVDTINILIGDGVNVLTTGVTGALRVDFRARITGSFIHEFDGLTGSIVLAIDKAAYVIGSAPSFTSIVGSAPPTMTSARYAADTTLTGWTTQINRGDVLRVSITSQANLMRVLLALRIRRLEP